LPLPFTYSLVQYLWARTLSLSTWGPPLWKGSSLVCKYYTRVKVNGNLAYLEHFNGFVPKILKWVSNLWTNISSIKRIVYHATIFGIQSLFVSVQFEIDWIVRVWPKITITKVKVAESDEHSSLLQFRIIYDSKNVCTSCPCKTFTLLNQHLFLLVDTFRNKLARF